MDMPRCCPVCHNLRFSRDDPRLCLEIRLEALMRTVDGNCQICDHLRYLIKIQPQKIPLDGYVLSMRHEECEPMVMTVKNKLRHAPLLMSFCIYSTPETTSRNLFIPSTRVENSGLKMNNEEDSFSFVRSCLADCTAGKNGHRNCKSQAPSLLPRRLLYIGSSEFRLIETQEELGTYAALSYCWGGEPKKHFRTLTSNVEKMRTSISKEDLPPVFKDAVTVLQSLGIEMLWIDSLCILQDNPRDWEIESSKMAQYYAGAHFTIAVDSSENPSVPFLGRLHSVYQPVSSSRGPYSLFCERIPTWSDIFSSDLNALLGRGWAFQESALSKRIIHYSVSGLFWECQAMIKPQHELKSSSIWAGPNIGLARTFSQLFTLRDGHERLTGILPGLRSLAWLFPAQKASLRPVDWIAAWMDLVVNYSSRSLTLHNDKLPAFSGIASAVSHVTGCTYLAGSWEETLAVSLCWFVENQKGTESPSFPTPMPASEGSPSWSWASINGEIEYSRHGFDRLYKDLIAQTCVLRSKCAAAGLNPFGQTRGGYVMLLGKITVARLSFNSSSLRFSLHPITGLPHFPSILPNIDTLLETCDCTTPIFHGAKTLRRIPASATYDPPALENVFVELIPITEFNFGVSVYLVLGRSPTVHGAHVRLGLCRASEEDKGAFRAGELPEPIVVTII